LVTPPRWRSASSTHIIGVPLMNLEIPRPAQRQCALLLGTRD
jgi:hypothetical protein